MTIPAVWLDRLAMLAVDCRPHGAPQWDIPGTVAALRRVQHLDLAEVAAACARGGADRSLRTPAALGDPSSSCYRERLTEPTPTRPRICPTHDTQYAGAVCPSCRADELAGDRPTRTETP